MQFIPVIKAEFSVKIQSSYTHFRGLKGILFFC